MRSVMPFAFDDALVRVHIDAQGQPWFVAKDVCAVLDISNHRDAVAPLDEDEKGVGVTDTLGGRQEMITVSESGLYALIFRSNKPEAKHFRKWVTAEVLPAIRRSGAYLIPGLTAEKKAALERLPESTKRAALNTAIKELAGLAGVYKEFAPQFKDDVVDLCLLFSPSAPAGDGKKALAGPAQHNLLGGAS